MIWLCGNPLRIAALVVCTQLLHGCGGGASGTDSTTPSEPALSASIFPDTYTCTRFIDAVTGADGNSGSTPDDAWASADRAVAHTQSSSARPGDVLCFKRGQRFQVFGGQLGVSGSATNPVTFGAYGESTDAPPRLSSAMRIDDRPEWVGMGNGVYLWPNSHPSWNVSGLWQGGIWQRTATSQALSDGNWYYAAGTGLYVRSSRRIADAGPMYLAIKHSIFGVHGLRNLMFRDLVFEYAGTGINGRPVVPAGARPTRTVSNILVKNCRFEHMTTGFMLLSETVNGTVHENSYISVIDNQFDDVRFAVHFGSSGNGEERHHFITVSGNTIRNVAINGSYAGDKSHDIEAISIQNAMDTRIADNRIERGLRREQGLTNVDGEPLFAIGVVLWRSPAVTLRRLRIERNYVDNMADGIVIGAGVEDGMRQVTVTNNIVSNSDTGIKINSTDTLRSSNIRFNTLFRNSINLHIASGGGQIVLNNFSIEPREYHVMLTGVNDLSRIDYNVYAPDGAFMFHTEHLNLLAFQSKWQYDLHSIVAGGAGLLSLSPQAPEDFKLTGTSSALGRGTAVGLEDGDFGKRARPAGSPVDVGAWMRHLQDG